MGKTTKKDIFKDREAYIKIEAKTGAGVVKHVSKVSGKNMRDQSADGRTDQRMQY